MSNLVYRIKNWDRCFENEKSRRVRRCAFVCLPNKRGVGYSHLFANKKTGLVSFGVFTLLAQACSRHEHRDGWLTVDGLATSHAWDVQDIVSAIGVDAATVSAALKVLSSDRIGWIQQVDPRTAAEHEESRPGGGRGIRGKRDVKSSNTPQIPRDNPADTPHTQRIPRTRPANTPWEGKGREGKRNQKSTSGSSEPARAASEPEHSGRPKTGSADPIVLTFPIVGDGGPDWHLCRSLTRELDDTFTTIDVTAEAKKALAWIKANPTRRKTERGMRRFLTNWMNRATNSGGARKAGGQQAAEDDLVIPDVSDEEADRILRDLGVLKPQSEAPVV